MKKSTIFVLLIFMAISLFLHLHKSNTIPPCLNADEAAFGYNAYSIFKTGKDEYGKTFPLRLMSFGDYKFPLYTYLSIPFVAFYGLNEFSTRAINIILGITLIPLMYFLAKELFENKKIALLSSFLVTMASGMYIVSRHAHETVLSAFLILLSLYFLIRFIKKKNLLNFFLTNLFILLGAFSYHNGRLFLLFIVLYQLFFLGQKKFLKLLFLVLIVVTPFFIDYQYGAIRVKNLFFTSTQGFKLRIDEYRAEHPVRLIHNKLTEAVRDVTVRYMAQISSEFFVAQGDRNPRFGMQNLGIITIVEYVFFFIGLYYLFKNKQRFRYLILFFMLLAPLNNALTWQEPSLTRSFVVIFPMLLIAAYGFLHLATSLKTPKIRYAILGIAILTYGFYMYNNWDLYFNHYSKRALVIRSWQCGYKELASYLKENYDNFDRFYITPKHGQPYIFLLFNFAYSPEKYQKQARLTPPDEFGFGQVENFDKYIFKFKFDPALKKTAFIGYPDDFKNLIQEQQIDARRIKKIKISTEEIFWIYET